MVRPSLHIVKRRRPPELADRFFGAVSGLEERVRQHFAFTLVIATAVVTLFLVLSEQLGRPLIIASGWLTFFMAWHLGLGLTRQAQDAIERLGRRNILVGPDDALKTLMTSSVESWSRRAAWGTALAMLVAFAAVSPEYWFGHPVPLTLALSETVAGFFAGRVLGQMIGIGTLGRRIKRGEWMIHPQPGHVDGAAGLKPVGDLYFHEAMVLAIPALFLAAWVMVAPNYPGVGWFEVYMTLLVAVVGLEVSVFVLPMLSFHEIMKREKRRFLVEVDERSEKLQRLEDELPDIPEDTRRGSVADQVARLQDRYRKVEAMPTWPIDKSIRLRFTIRNVLLLLPVIGSAVNALVTSMDNVRNFFRI